MAGSNQPRDCEDEAVDLVVRGVAGVCELIVAKDAAQKEAARRSFDCFEQELRRQAPKDATLVQLTERFELGSFELKVVLLALAPHVEPRISEMLAGLGRHVFGRAVSVRLAIEHFVDASTDRVFARKKLLPSSGLVRNGLITLGKPELGGHEGLMSRRIELSAPTLRFLLGEDELSEQVARYAQLERPEVSLLNVILEQEQLDQVRELVEQHGRYRKAIASWGFDQVLPYGHGLTLLFSGLPGTGKTMLARALANHMGRPLLSVSASDLPARDGIEAAFRDLFNEATMRDAIVLVDECDALLTRGDNRKAAAFKAIERHDGILILISNHPEALDEGLERRIIYDLRFEVPDAELRRHIWDVHLPPGVPIDPEVDLDILANMYDFTGGAIKNAILVAVNRALARSPDAPCVTMELLDEGCRSQLRYALEELTERSRTHLRLDDIVLPDEAMEQVLEIIAAIRNQAEILNRWGFSRRLATGKGLTVLFDGISGTGKTLCAEIIAGEFDRPIYRVNIPEVVSKWVGETEKNIRAIFQMAKVSHAMLLFDEADALFSARSAETRTATDRHANMEVNLLLQEIERFPGVVIMTTNFFGSLDKALIRRIQFRVTFEEPDQDQRRRIWETLCPDVAPRAADVDWAKLAAKYEMTGGMIKNALVRAAYRACEARQALDQAVLEKACRDEQKAAGRLTRDPGWKPPPNPFIGEIDTETGEQVTRPLPYDDGTTTS